ncbi:MAG: deoxynucleoside kinase [Eubacteriales bacterium]|nr:deoxynucleoside kinase [Eubacteriales bacterium]
MKGKLFVMEGLDGCGKQTQTALLKEKLIQMGYNVMTITFPDYDSGASTPVKMYLNGEFGDKASEVSPYMASAFYAVDRIASYKKHWEKELQAGTIVIADRYTTSNMLHQATKLEGAERDEYLDWLTDFEFNRLGLPVPDGVIYLDMPQEFARTLRSQRDTKFEGSDIHEKDREYLEKCSRAAQSIADKYGWKTVKCVVDEKLRTIEEINEEVVGLAEAWLWEK